MLIIIMDSHLQSSHSDAEIYPKGHNKEREEKMGEKEEMLENQVPYSVSFILID